MQIKKLPGCILLMGLLTVTAGAVADNWYMGLGIGATETDVFDENINDLTNLGSLFTVTGSINTEDTGFKIFGGRDISEYFAVELGYLDLGELLDIDARIIGDGSFSSVLDIDLSEKWSAAGIYIAGVGSLSLTELLALSGRFGVYFWESDYDIEVTDNISSEVFAESTSDSDSSGFLGVGFHVGPFAIQYEVYDVGEDNVDYLGVSFQRYFR